MDQTLHRISLGQEHILTTIATSSNDRSTVQNHLEEMRVEISRITSKSNLNPLYRIGLRRAVEKAMQDILRETIDSDPRQALGGPSGLISSTKSQSTARFHGTGSWPCKLQFNSNVMYHDFSTIETMLGAFYIEVKRTLRNIRFSDDSPQGSQASQYENSRTLVFYPANWVTALGLNYSFRLRIHESSIKGWNHTLTISRAVPDDSLIFDFAKQGNLSAMRTLMSRGLASVRDTDSYGRTALYVS